MHTRTRAYIRDLPVKIGGLDGEGGGGMGGGRMPVRTVLAWSLTSATLMYLTFPRRRRRSPSTNTNITLAVAPERWEVPPLIERFLLGTHLLTRL